MKIKDKTNFFSYFFIFFKDTLFQLYQFYCTNPNSIAYQIKLSCYNQLGKLTYLYKSDNFSATEKGEQSDLGKADTSVVVFWLGSTEDHQHTILWFTDFVFICLRSKVAAAHMSFLPWTPSWLIGCVSEVWFATQREDRLRVHGARFL